MICIKSTFMRNTMICSIALRGRKFREVTDDDLLAVADRFAIGTGPKVLKQVKEVFKGGD